MFCLLFCLSARYSAAQVYSDIEWYNVDSLLDVLPGQEGEQEMSTLNALASSFSFENKETCRKYALEALAMAEELNNDKGRAAAIRNLGHMEFYDGFYPQALNHYQEALKLYEALGDMYMAAHVLEDIGATHFFARNYDKALEICNEAMDIYLAKDEAGKTLENTRDMMTLSSRMGLLYRYTGHSDIAKNIYLKYVRDGKYMDLEVTDYMLHHGLLAMCYYESGNYDSAFYYFKQAYDFPDVNMSIKAMKHTHMFRRAGIHLELRQTDTAIRLLEESFQWCAEKGFLKISQLASSLLGEIYFNEGKYSKAEKYYRLSEDQLEEMLKNRSYYRYDSMKYIVSWGSELYLPFTRKNVIEIIYLQAISLYERLYILSMKKNDLKPAMNYMIALSAAKDSLRILGRNRETIEIQTRYESARKDDEILRLSQQNEIKELRLFRNSWLMIGLLGMMILIVLLAIALIRQNRLRSNHRALLFQQRLLRTQMNPHFLFNTLTSIQHYIINKDSTMASDYLGRFSKLVRQILNNSALEFIPLEDEISSIENYLDLQKLRFRNMFDYTIVIDENIDAESVLVPPMLAQPFIENAIEHGFKYQDEKGKLKIDIRLNGNLIRVTIEDNGIGRKQAQEIHRQQNRGHTSMSTTITRERLQVLKKRTHQKTHIHISDLTDENGHDAGTRVVFDVPYKD